MEDARSQWAACGLNMQRESRFPPEKSYLRGPHNTTNRDALAILLSRHELSNFEDAYARERCFPDNVNHIRNHYGRIQPGPGDS